ncbi:hypothetical protein HYH03_005920 [Edaphochlamys debaryana]|uniref:Hexosyltransferase n=1 Tax=Edaphochlamys debaryana TaxID=47281 RepID=A0A835Y6I8_9CHLO|nr:hypothetical protein HYH03_005920 [Edaphochlamys debaryana]|eukprot:KAG2495997.1 hypothetical protein HYH03_005920 [Edaphochlamys debaryana]
MRQRAFRVALVFYLVFVAASLTHGDALRPVGGRYASVVGQPEDILAGVVDPPSPEELAANAKKLAIVYLVTKLAYKSHDRVALLRASLRLVSAHLAPATPCVAYVFTRDSRLAQLRAQLADLVDPGGGDLVDPARGADLVNPGGGGGATSAAGGGSGTVAGSGGASGGGGQGGGAAAAGAEAGAGAPLLRVRVLPLANGSWAVPEWARDMSLWKGRWPRSYRLMGDWRLSYMPRFARAMGHRYLLQLDDDSYITGPVNHDLVTMFDRHGYWLGVHTWTTDPPLVTWGLPELAKFFLLTYQVDPGTLLRDHCAPPSLDGLHSGLGAVAQADEGELRALAARYGLPRAGEGGWDRRVPAGNCVLLGLDWWFGAMVQRFVQLCRTSGGSMMYRWNEQAVVGMAAHIFVSPERLHALTFPFQHRGEATQALRAGGLQP